MYGDDFTPGEKSKIINKKNATNSLPQSYCLQRGSELRRE